MPDQSDHNGDDERIEAVLRESEEMFAKAFHSSPIGNILIRRNDHIIVEVNDAFLKAVGYGRDELIGREARIIHYMPRGLMLAATQAAFAAGRGVEGIELRFVRKDGSIGHCVRSNHPIRIGSVDYGLGTLIDITERKQIEQSLRDSQARLQAALEGGGMGTWIWDIQKNEAWWDDAAVRLFGRTPAAKNVFPREQALSFIHPEDRAHAAAALGEAVTTGCTASTEFRSARPDGRLQWLLSRGHAMYDDTGQLVSLAGVFIDVTERKRAEEARTHSQKMEALGTLAGGIAHDFNNILLAITGNARLALADLQPQHPVAASLTEIEKAGGRAADLVRRILVFSRQQEARREINTLPAIIEEALKLIRPTLSPLIEIRVALSPDTPAVAAESVQIHQVMMNLATNAAYAIGQNKGLIEVRLDPVIINSQSDDCYPGLSPGRYARLTVSDSGSGMDQATAERIFDPFFTTKPPGQGTGLGLPVVHGIVKSHGGTINVYTHPGKGTTFRLYFPAAEVPAAVVEKPIVSTSPGNAEHILYVDDEEPLVVLASRMLQRLGYASTVCTDPQQALDTFCTAPHTFNAVVTDLSMRGMSGFELAGKLREIRPDVPILMTSGYMRMEDRERAAQLGIHELITKPNSMEDLGQALARVFGRVK
jgi:PAS domain S-box-containing protein